ncbi:MAG: tRNA (adenosine(37)-N6)-dimethylallyltransferase MiaA [Dichotomicrobium sp.]
MTAEHAIVIAGPTASGKSAFALDMAERHGGMIVNADSMQVYEELNILTARPGPADTGRVPHRLYGFRSGAEPYSVGQWLEDAAEALAEARRSGHVPIVVGGTGLYFKALFEGLSPVPEIAQEIRAYWRDRAEQADAPALHAMLAARDPAAAAQLRPSDTQRILRALEVIDATGHSITAWQERAGTPLLDESRTRKFVVAPERAALYRACDTRAERMIAAGAADEVAALLGQDLDPSLPVMRAIGVRPLTAYLRGEIDLPAALLRLQTETRRYAKRQLTWARRNMISWKWIIPE